MRPLIWVVLVEALVFGVLGFLWVTRAAASNGGESLALQEESEPAAPNSGGASSADRETRVARARGEAGASSAKEKAGAASIVVCGTVRDAEGQPIAGASVTFTRLGTSRRGASANNGAYAVPSLNSGTWLVSCRAKDFADLRVEHALDDRARQTIDLVLGRTHLVEVLFRSPTGEPVYFDRRAEMHGMALSVIATLEPLSSDLPPFTATRIEAGGIGTWADSSRLDGAKAEEAKRRGLAGELSLSQEPPAHVALFLRQVFLASQRIEASERELVFTVDPAQLEGRLGSVALRVIDGATGAPMQDANVILATQQSFGIGVGDSKTNVDGRARIERVMPGSVLLQVNAPGREYLVQPIRVPSGRELDLGDIVLSKQVAITGRVVAANAAELRDVSISCSDLDQRSAADELDPRACTTEIDVEGRFAFPYAGAHRYAVRASARGLSGYAVVDARSGPPSPMEIHLAATTPIDVRSDARRDRVISIVDEADVPVRVFRIGLTSSVRSFSLPPGAYTLRVYAEAEQVERTLPLRVGAEPFEVDLR